MDFWLEYVHLWCTLNVEMFCIYSRFHSSGIVWNLEWLFCTHSKLTVWFLNIIVSDIMHEVMWLYYNFSHLHFTNAEFNANSHVAIYYQGSSVHDMQFHIHRARNFPSNGHILHCSTSKIGTEKWEIPVSRYSRFREHVMTLAMVGIVYVHPIFLHTFILGIRNEPNIFLPLHWMKRRQCLPLVYLY